MRRWCAVISLFAWVGCAGVADRTDDESVGTTEAALCSAPTLSASSLGPVPLGTTIVLSAKSATCAAGETAEYRFFIRRDGATTQYTELRPYSTAAQLDLQTASLAPGKYTVLVYSRAVGTTVLRDGFSTLNLLIGPTCTDVALAATPGSPQLPGPTVQVTATGACSEGAAVEHRLLAKLGSGSYVEVAGWGSSPFQWETATLPRGPYTLQVYTRAVGNASTFEATRTLAYRLGAECTQLTGALTPASAAPPGTPVSISATTTCSGGASAEYQFSYRPGSTGAFQVIAPWSSSAQVNWDTTGLTTGAYQVRLEARANDYPWPAQVTKALTYNVGGVCTAATLAVGPKSPQPLGSLLSLSSTATCVGSPIEYRFLRKDSLATDYTEIAAFGPTANVVFDSTNALPGPYTFQVQARVQGSPTAFSKTAAYQLGAVCTSVNLSATPSSPQPAGTPVTATAAATCSFGGVPEYRFSVRTGSGPWQTFRDWGGASANISGVGLGEGAHTLRVETRGQGHPGAPESSRTLAYTFNAPCAAGYQSNGSGCVDIDECATNNGGCSPARECLNQPGSFECGPCPVGYVTSGSTGCADVDECLTGNGGCDPLATCTNIDGGRLCGPCPTGYAAVGGSCVDVDECGVNNGGCSLLRECINQPGTWECGPCPAGFNNAGSTDCADIDECLTDNGGCDGLTICSNTAGGRDCGPCPPGYSGSGVSGCQDLNECGVSNGGCDPLTTCTNSAGGYSCGPCPMGYTGSGASGCQDLNECEVNNGGCDPLTTCLNSAGGYSCGPCPPGYSGSGQTGCVPAANPCSPNPCQNGGSCSPSGTSYGCTCVDGYGGSNCEIAPVTLLAAGDIGDCNTTADTATGLLLGEHAGTILPLGDIAYPNGSSANFTNCFHPVWGAHLARMKPVAGNHEYGTANAAGYFNYFGAAAGDPAKGYYSYDLGTWHIVALNSNCTKVSCSAGSAQEQWLRQDLAANPSACTLAYFHHPRFSSGGEHGNNTAVAPLWRALVDNGVELALAGHDHNYERFAAQDDNAVATPNGVVQFVVGTGGTALRPMGSVQANSQARNATDHGLLKLTLSAGAYSYAFVPIAGKTYSDSGTASCH